MFEMALSRSRQKFGVWSLGKKLGGGGNGDVWQASSSSGDVVALKVLRRLDAVSYARFRSEIAVLSNNGDVEGIIPLIESYLPESTATESPCYVMPLATPCATYLKDKSPVDIVREFIALARTIDTLHGRRISHRDIKPQNILAYKNRLCISDFGLVKYPEREPLTPPKRDVGPKFTMAPEMRRKASEADGEPADVFSFAKTLWIGLTKQELGFDGQYSLNSNIALKDYMRGLYTTKLDTLLTDCTDNAPDRRPTMGQVVQRLSEWIEVEEDFERRNAIEWIELMQLLFPAGAPERATWTDIDAICAVLTEIGKIPGLNHMFYPGGGGNTITHVMRSKEEGFIEIEALGAFLVKPNKLTFESFGSSPDWNYFRFEAEEIDPLGEDISHRGYFEYLTEIEPGRYGPPHLWDRAQDGSDCPLPPTARLILRFFRGAFVVFSTRSPYNLDSSTYDGRHSKMSEEEFRRYIQRSALVAKGKT